MNEPPPSSHQQRYPTIFRMIEITGIGVFLVLVAWMLVRLWPTLGDNWAVAVSAALLGTLTMDFISGMLHWAGDTWGSVRWPYIGSTVLRTFREHHVDPESITRHDLVEVNATNALIAIPVLSAGHWAAETSYFGGAYTLTIALTGIVTNQIHLWAHRRDNPWWIRWLQRTRLILSPEAHALHHERPHTDHYCITTGWLNVIFAKTRFFRGLEWIVSRVTGAVPREEDILAEMALESHQRTPT